VPLAFALCSVGVLLAMFGFAATSPGRDQDTVFPAGSVAKAAASTPLAPTGPGWSLVTSPNTSATQTNYLNRVTCASASDCWAVGYYRNGSGGSGVAQTLIQHWNGTSWSIVPSPNTSPTQGNYLTGATCASAANCWAVGYYYSASGDGGPAQTLVEHWNGTAWSITPANNTSSSQNNYFFGVACASASQCWAVGYFFNGTSTQGLIERWDGTSWAIATSPSAANYILDVTCISTSQCWAVGSVFPSGYAQTLTERWDGTSWAVVPSPSSDPGQDNYLYGVTCTSPSDCWAVGSYDPAPDTGLSIIERWNGSSWVFVSSPNPGPTYLKDVTCTSAASCWAVGLYFDNESTFLYKTLIVRWNGTSWSTVTSPDKAAPNNNYLNGVTCTSASQCWAVGYSGYNQGGVIAQTLIEEYSPNIPPLTAIGSRKIHGSMPFDVDLLNAPPGIECRSPGATGSSGVDHKIIFSFVNNVTSCGTASTGSLSNGPALNECTVDLTGVTNQQYVTVTLNNVLDSQTNTGNVSTTMGVLLGDVNANGLVNSTDTSLVQAQSGKPLTPSNFRMDVNANGLINSTDSSIVQSKSGNGF
jgi:hypothetical protein